MAVEDAVAGVRDNAPAFITSLAGSAAVSIHCGFDAADQDRSGEGFGQEANSSGSQRPGTDALLGEGCNEDERHGVTPRTHMRQQVQTAHAGHLDIGDDTRGVIRVGRLQEVLGGGKCMDPVPMRAQEIVGRCSDGCIVIND